MSFVSIEMARAVLVDGASFKEAAEAAGKFGSSRARHAVYGLLKYIDKQECAHSQVD